MNHPGRGIGALRDFKFGQGIGGTVVEPDGPVTAGRLGRWRFTYTAGSSGVALGGAVRFTPPNGFSAPQFADPAAPGCCAFSSSKKGASLAPSLWEPELGLTFLPSSLTLTLSGAPLEEGDRVEIDYGWTPSGIPGARAQLLAMPAAFNFTVDAAGDGRWELVPDPPVIDVRPEAPARLIATSPAQAAPGEPFAIRLAVRDRFGNVVPDYRGEVRLTLAGGKARLPDPQEMSGGIGRIAGAAIEDPGVHRIGVEADGLPPARTPPIRVAAETLERKLLFGDPHCMTGLCVGEYPAGLDAQGIVDYVHTYARDAAAVDFGACTSLGYRMGDAEWRAVLGGARDSPSRAAMSRSRRMSGSACASARTETKTFIFSRTRMRPSSTRAIPNPTCPKNSGRNSAGWKAAPSRFPITRRARSSAPAGSITTPAISGWSRFIPSGGIPSLKGASALW